MSTFDSTKTRLGDLLKEISQGKIQLPDFQRGWVWDDEHIQSLLVSIARSFPVGAVMLLENGGETRFKMRPVEGINSASVANMVVEKLILDGQQRLTSLTQVLMLNKPVQTRDNKKRDIERFYYVDINKALEGPEHYHEAFFSVEKDRTVHENFGRDIKMDLRTPELEYQNFCFPCNQLLNWSGWLHGLSQHNPQKLQDFLQFQKRVIGEFENYQVPIISLGKTTTKEAVCLVFEKVNTGGMPLSVFELITATYAADGVNLRDEWFGNKTEGVDGIHQHLSRQKMLADIAPTDYFQGLSILHTYQLRLRDLAAGKAGKQATGVSAKRETVLSLPLAAYQEWKDSLRDGFWNAARFLRKESFFTPNDLPYRTQLVPLATILALLGERWLEQRVYEKLARWYWCGVLGELYGGAVETRMALDVQEFMAWLKDETALPSTVRDANFQPARLETLRSRNSAAYKGISVLIQRNGAQDWFWKSTIRDLNENDWEESKLDIHHIFPKDWCEKQGIHSRRYNAILNKTPISYKANRMIGGKAPSKYLEQLQQHKSVHLDEEKMDILLKTHLMNTVFLRANDFDAFIESRKALMVDIISKAMGKDLIASNEQVADDEEDENELQTPYLLNEDDHDDEDHDTETEGKVERRAERDRRLLNEVMPEFDKLGIECKKNKYNVLGHVGEYRVRVGARSGGKFTLNIFSTDKTVEEALKDFPGTKMPDYRTEKNSEDRWRKATMGMAELNEIMKTIKIYQTGFKR